MELTSRKVYEGQPLTSHVDADEQSARQSQLDVIGEKGAPGSGTPLPIIQYEPDALISALPIYRNRPRELENMKRIIAASEGYDWFVVSIPANEADRLVFWRETYRDQISVPPGSFLVMIQGVAIAAV